MARLRRMYAHLLFVVVGILGPVWRGLWTVVPSSCRLVLSAGFTPALWNGALASPGAADIRWRHE